jgi:glycyl-tRNA synthetase beta chain
MPRFVLEIGTEEIPPRFFPPALAQLRQDGEARFGRARLSFTELKVYGTPRRLVLIAENLAERQAPHQREERGPAAKVAFDKDGNPTKAAQGFADRYRLKPEDLVVRKTEQGEYVYAIIQEPELPAKEALPSLLPDLITGLSFPKTMRWGTGKLRFGRPIRWLLALLDSEVVEFELDGIKSGRLTRGHPTVCATTPARCIFAVKCAADYETDLYKSQVMVNQNERRMEIGKWVQVRASEARGRPLDGSLLDVTTFLVEWPTAGLGRFDPAFLRLPRPVLVDEMQHVQSYFPLEDDKGSLLPKFIAVRDGGEDHLDSIIRGWERVLRAKLIDADFFYHQDLKTPLAERVEAIKGVVFQEKLGTMYEKMERTRAVAAALADELQLDDQRSGWLQRAALLCKADLTTELVTELPGLQGVMGAIYAEQSGESEEVSVAISNQYDPLLEEERDTETDVPSSPYTTIGTFLAIADKTDTVASCFAVGLTPSGSADPLALRREGTYLVRCFIEGRLRDANLHERFAQLSARYLVRVVLDRLASASVRLAGPPDQVTEAVIEFLLQRLDGLLLSKVVRHDLIRAAFAVGDDPLRLAYERAHALRRVSAKTYFLETVIACTRPMNIARGFEGENVEVDPGLFEESAEHDLWNAYTEVEKKVRGRTLIGKDLDALFGDIYTFLVFRTDDDVAPIDRYFNDVLVMAEDPALRRNRLAMCWQLSQLFRRIADFTLIVQV